MRKSWTAAVVLPFLFACGTHTRGPRRAPAPSPIEIRLVAESQTSAPTPAWPGGEPLVLEREVLFDRDDIASIEPGQGGDDGDYPVLHLQLTDAAGRRFEEATAAHVGRRLAIVVDGRIAMAPVVRDSIAGGAIEITTLSESDIQELERRLSKAGE